MARVAGGKGAGKRRSMPSAQELLNTLGKNVFGDHWRLSANWRTNSIDCRQIVFNFPDGAIENFQLGLCPEEAYQSMIKDAVEHVDDHEFWIKQYEIDTWIHERIEKL